MARKKNYDYFDAFKDISKVALEISDNLCDLISNYNPEEEISERIEHIRSLEQKADCMKHEMMEALYRDFLPPVEREDIISMSNAMDDIIDNIDEVGLRLEMYQPQELPKEMVEMSQLVCEIVRAQDKVIGELKKFKKSKKLHDYIVEVNSLEKNADKLHLKAMKKVYSELRDEPVKIMIQERLYRLLEECCDSVEKAANAAEGLRLKNS